MMPTPTLGRRAALLLTSVLTAAPLLVTTQVAVAATGPTAVDDTATVSTGWSVTLPGATNDRAGTAPIQGGLTVFPTDGQPIGATVGDGGRTLQVPKHGTFSTDADGRVTFTAWTRLTGDVSARYRITDASGATADGRLTVAVTAGGLPDYVLANYGLEIPVTDVLANDTPGRNADGTLGSLDRTSVRFDDYLPWGGSLSADRRTVTFPNVGVASLDDFGLLSWRAYPSSSYYESSADVHYTAQDTTRRTNGTQEHHTFSSVVRVVGGYNTDPDRVRPTDDHVATPYGASVVMPGSTDDHPHDPLATMRPDLSRFDLGDSELGPDTRLSADGRKIRYPGRGTWTINPDGTVTYVPRSGFVGTDGVIMMVVDSNFSRGYEELRVDVRPGPSAKADASTSTPGTATSVDVLGNDVPGRNADGTAGSMDASFVRFPTDGQPAGAAVSAYARTLTVPGEGTYTADRVTGAVGFTPARGSRGAASPVTYSARDTVTRTDGRTVHHAVTATLTVEVVGVAPVALDNWASTVTGTPVDVAVLGNDRPGSAAVPLVPSSVRLRLTPDLPDGSRLSGDTKTLVVAGAGTFVAGTDGVVTFTPVQGFVGTVPAIGYQVADTDGTTVRATITVRVGATR